MRNHYYYKLKEAITETIIDDIMVAWRSPNLYLVIKCEILNEEEWIDLNLFLFTDSNSFVS